MAADKQFDGAPLITGCIGIDDIVKDGFDALVEYKDRNVKILVHPG